MRQNHARHVENGKMNANYKVTTAPHLFIAEGRAIAGRLGRPMRGAELFGLDAEINERLLAKRDPQWEATVLAWIEVPSALRHPRRLSRAFPCPLFSLPRRRRAFALTAPT